MSAANIASFGAWGQLRDVHIADMDKDGDMDVVASRYHENKLYWFKNDGAADPTWSEIVIENSTPEGVFGI